MVEWSFVVMFGGIGLAALLAVLLVGCSAWLGDYTYEIRSWRKRKKELEADRIIGYANKGADDDWRVRMEAKIQAHDIRKPDLPWPLGGD